MSIMSIQNEASSFHACQTKEFFVWMHFGNAGGQSTPGLDRRLAVENACVASLLMHPGRN